MNRFALLLILFSLLIFKAYGQLKLTGKAADQQGHPVELATIKLEGLNRIAMSNDSGYFHLNLPAAMKIGDPLIIDASKEGYTSAVKHIKLSDSSVLIILNDNSTKSIKSIIKIKSIDTDYIKNKAFSIQQTGASSQRKLEQENIKDIFYALPADKNKRIEITCIKDDPEALGFATSIHDFLVLNGYKNVSDVLQVAFPKPIIGQFLNRDASGLKITIGHKP